MSDLFETFALDYLEQLQLLWHWLSSKSHALVLIHSIGTDVNGGLKRQVSMKQPILTMFFPATSAMAEPNECPANQIFAAPAMETIFCTACIASWTRVLWWSLFRMNWKSNLRSCFLVSVLVIVPRKATTHRGGFGVNSYHRKVGICTRKWHWRLGDRAHQLTLGRAENGRIPITEEQELDVLGISVGGHVPYCWDIILLCHIFPRPHGSTHK